ncbi:MAG: ABC transporter permease [Desulfobacterales bacterium]|nr:ABC transporter permease [Desulfobacterales bacterium]
MIIKANLMEALNSLYQSRQRSILALIGIVIGIGSVIAMVSIGTIVQNRALKQFQEMGTNLIRIQQNYQSTENGSQETLSLQDSIEIPKHCTDILNVAPFASFFGNAIYNNRRMNFPVLGVTESFMELCKIKLKQGRFISDLDEMSYFCVISNKIAEKLSEMGVLNPINEKIILSERIFTIVGVIEPVFVGGLGPYYEINEGALIPITIALRIGKEQNITISSIMGILKSAENGSIAQEQITSWLELKKSTVRMRVTSAEELISQMKQQSAMFTLLLGIIASISLIVGGVGVMNVMLVSVSERKTEIGIRRSLGAQQLDIYTQFIIESIVLCFIGGLFGVGIGIMASWIVSHINNWEFTIAQSAVWLGIGVSCVVGIFFGFYPARQAAKLNPTEALRGN